MGTSAHLAQKRIEDAARLVAATEERLQEETGENRKAFERFYNNLALFSGGTIALSVTYLGYLKSVPKPISYEDLLVASWVSLLGCLVSSLFCPFFCSDYMHYARHGEYVRNRAKQRQTAADALDSLNVVNARSPSEREALQKSLRDEAEAYSKDEKWAARRESIYMRLWVWSGRVSRLTFVAGLGLLV